MANPTGTVLVLSALAGAIHVLAPDHWLPSSVLVWQRGWSFRRSVLFALGVFSAHVLMGAMIYFLTLPILSSLEAGPLFIFGLALILGVMGLRMVRFARIRNVLGSGTVGLWGAFSVISLLGPCESIIPILLKARHLGTGYLYPILAFILGTWASGTACILFGRVRWNRPFWLPWGIQWARRKAAILPVMAVLLISLSAIFRVI